MKKKLCTLAATCLVFSGVAFGAGTVRENCGCGIGSMALGEETGLLSHLAATFLNGISGNQTFGISSGTLDCDQSTTLVSIQEVEVFVADNMDHIATEAAVGEGAYLSALADLLKVEDSRRGEFYASMQVNFDEIFTGPHASSEDVTRSIVQLI